MARSVFKDDTGVIGFVGFPFGGHGVVPIVISAGVGGLPSVVDVMKAKRSV